MDPEDMFSAVLESYKSMVQSQEIAKRDHMAESHQMHIEVDEMQAWDGYVLEAIKQGIGATHQDLSARATDCAAFANELLKRRRVTFLYGDKE